MTLWRSFTFVALAAFWATDAGAQPHGERWPRQLCLDDAVTRVASTCIASYASFLTEEQRAHREGLQGKYVLIAQRRASRVAAPLPDGRMPEPRFGSQVDFSRTGNLVWLDGKACADWRAIWSDRPNLEFDDPMLSDAFLGPLRGPASTGDRRLNRRVDIFCGQERLATILVVDKRVLVVESPEGAHYTLLEKPLSPEQMRRLQEQLKLMKFYQGKATGDLDAATRKAVAAYAEYRGASYRFEPAVITENLLDGLGVLDAAQ